MRKWLFGLLLCAVVGIVAQTVVAWVYCVYTDYTGGSGLIVVNGGRDVSSATGFVPPMDWDGRYVQRWWSIGKTRETISEMEWVGSLPMMRQWAAAVRRTTAASAGLATAIAGWDGLDRSLAGIVCPLPLLDVPLWIKGGGWRVPVQPLWAGLLVNTVVFAVPAFCVVWGVAWCRRRGRVKRGECLQCGYPRVGGARCPECGLDGSRT